MTRHQANFIGVINGYGAGNPACQDGPAVLRAMDFLSDLSNPHHTCRWDEPIRVANLVQPDSDRLGAIADIAGQLADRVEAHLRAGHFPVVIGGDHSCAIGTWSGVKRHIGEKGRLGLIWIDAHMDSHTFRSSPSQNIHGMPLACLLGHGSDRLTSIANAKPKLLPEDVCLIGVRSFEWQEAALLMTLGVRVYFMDEIARRGIDEVFAEAHRHVGERTVGYGISFDLDALDPAEEPGVGTPVPGGLLRADIIEALRVTHSDQKLLALEIVEYNPYADKNFMTAGAIHDVCRTVIP